ncbi:MAG: hypothetical protein KKC23_05685 [Proteobacteria bacterium]|nr:hypothetical protein [Pseudomonadota bacterium]
MSENTRVIKAAGVVGASTLLSRIFGFIRDVVIAWFFGAGLSSDAFFVAFRIPNLLRRLLAEGAALVGVYERIGADLAREYQLYLAFGSTLMTGQDGRLSDVAYLFGPDGEVLGKQRRTHLSSVEDEREWFGGDSLRESKRHTQ